MCALLVCIVAGVPTAGGSEPDGVKERQRAPEFNLVDSHGERVRLSDFRGRPVIVNFWATWCEPCRREMRALDQLHRDFERLGLIVVGIGVDEAGWRKVLPFVREHGLSFRIALADRDVRRDYLSGDVLPQTVFIDREGFIVARYEAVLDEEPLFKIADAMLGRGD